MKILTHLCITFENCEHINIPYDMVSSISFDLGKTSISYSGDRTNKVQNIKNVRIDLTEKYKSLQVLSFYPGVPFVERVTQCRDITWVSLKYESGPDDNYAIKFNGEENKKQLVEIDDDKMVIYL